MAHAAQAPHLQGLGIACTVPVGARLARHAAPRPRSRWYCNSMSLQPIQNVLSERGDVRQAITFGSMAAGTARFDSDLDIAIDLGQRMTWEQKAGLVAALAQACGRPVDVVDLRDIGEPLLGQVLRHGVRLIGSDADYAGLMRRHVFDSEDFLPYVRRMLRERRQQWIGTS